MSSTNEISSMLRNAGLKVTPNRTLILQVFRQHKHALSYSDLESTISENLDKVTIYRTLKSFEEKGIIHEVIDTSNQVRYALCNHNCSDDFHQDAHAHFNCFICDKTYCIDDSDVPLIAVPKGFEALRAMMLVEGICPDCKGN